MGFVELIAVAGGPFSAIRCRGIDGSGGFILRAQPKSVLSARNEISVVPSRVPETKKTLVRANVCAPIKEGKYYYELLLTDRPKDLRAMHAVGWCDSQWNTSRNSIGEDAHSWAFSGSPSAPRKYHNDAVRLAEATARRNAQLPSPSPSPAFPYADHEQQKAFLKTPEINFDDLDCGSLSDLGSPQSFNGGAVYVGGEPYGRPWKEGDVVGCGIEIADGRFNVTFYLNGCSLDVAWTDCTYVGHGLFPACAIDDSEKHKMVFDEEDLVFLPKKDGFKPVYVMM